MHEGTMATKENSSTPLQPSEGKQLDFMSTLFPTLQTHSKQSRGQALKATTMFTPLPSVVEEGCENNHRGINWPHYENMLKLFALGYLIQGTPTQQQEKDKVDLATAIEKVGNAQYKKKHLDADKIIKNASGVYMCYGKNVIRAMAERDPQVSERCLKDLRSEILDTRNENNAKQLHKTMRKAKTIFMKLQSRYREKE